ncbi:hypothetical protein EV424DRAFT_1515907 [Suillus variegatus]|nr:hypothetical protein EV424DRAFT_1515907 [Suillus variegatus]
MRTLIYSRARNLQSSSRPNPTSILHTGLKMADFTPINQYGPRTCQRCNVKFDMSVAFEYVRGKDGSGRLCCPGCAKHYADRKAAELMPNSTGVDFTSGMGASRHALVKATSAAQRGEQFFPSQRFSSSMTTTSGSGKMLPPPAPVSLNTLLRPTDVPGGYTSNHRLYNEHRGKMLLVASSTRVQTVTIRAAIHHLKPEGKSGTLLVGNLERDMRVPLTVTRAGLRFSIIQHLQSLWIEWSRNNSQVTLESLEMHKLPMMILFDAREPLNDPDAMVLQDFFLRSTAKDPVPKFHASTKVAILLIMTHAQYESVQLWREQIDESRFDNVDCMTGDIQTSTHAASHITQSQHSKKLRSPSSTSPSSSRVYKRIKQGTEISVIPESTSSLTDMSTSVVTTALPSRISSAIVFPEASQLCLLPSQQQLMAAMEAQGSIRKQASATISKYQSSTFRVYGIRSVKFHDIVTTPLDITHSRFDLVLISVDSDPKSMIGAAGSFKTCHPALLHTASLTPTTSTSDEPSLQATIFTARQVVAKRVFFRKGEGKKRHRFSKEDELGKTLDEANCLYWATCLMSLVYIFVDEMIETKTVKAAVADQVPRLRLVHAAVAIPDDTSDHAGAATYLLEERIEGKFIKYINNNSAVPTYHLRGFEEKIGLFLCFAQHVQHRLTNEVVYLSDFQGSGNLLTDCQVMTGPEYSANFGEGNCTEAFHAFKSTHKCNFYCRAFGMQPFSSTAPNS